MLDLVHVGHELARERAFREVVFDGVRSLDFLPLFALFWPFLAHIRPFLTPPQPSWLKDAIYVGFDWIKWDQKLCTVDVLTSQRGRLE